MDSAIKHNPLGFAVVVVMFFSSHWPCRKIDRPLNIFSGPSGVIVHIYAHIPASWPDTLYSLDDLPRFLVPSGWWSYAWHSDDPLAWNLGLFNIMRASHRIVGHLNTGAAWQWFSLIEGCYIRPMLTRGRASVVGDPPIGTLRRWHILHVPPATVRIFDDRWSPNTCIAYWRMVVVDLTSGCRHSTGWGRHCLHPRRRHSFIVLIALLINNDSPCWRRHHTAWRFFIIICLLIPWRGWRISHSNIASRRRGCNLVIVPGRGPLNNSVGRSSHSMGTSLVNIFTRIFRLPSLMETRNSPQILIITNWPSGTQPRNGTRHPGIATDIISIYIICSVSHWGLSPFNYRCVARRRDINVDWSLLSRTTTVCWGSVCERRRRNWLLLDVSAIRGSSLHSICDRARPVSFLM